MNEKKRKQKQYYVNQAKRAKFEKRKLHPGLRGFLCTTNNKERECVREAYNLLNEYSNQMYGAEHETQESAAGSADVEENLEAELAALKKEKVSKERRFQQVESGAKNCIFISTQLESTTPLVEKIAQDIQQSGTQRTRYLLRLLPVQVTCKATEEDIRTSAEPMIKEAFTELGVTYTTVFRSRNQAQLTQTDAQTAINNLIDAVCPTARLDHKTPKLTVLMEVIRNVICLGVVRDYFQMRKYNLVELAKGSAGSAEDGGEGGDGGDESKDGKGSGEAGCEEGEQSVASAAGKDSAEDSAMGESGESEAAGAEEGSAATTAAEGRTEPPPPAENPSDAPAADQADAAASSDASGTPAASSDANGTQVVSADAAASSDAKGTPAAASDASATPAASAASAAGTEGSGAAEKATSDAAPGAP